MHFNYARFQDGELTLILVLTNLLYKKWPELVKYVIITSFYTGIN